LFEADAVVQTARGAGASIPNPVIRKSTSWATLTSVLAGAGALALVLEARLRTVQPWRCTNNAATSFSISSALSLPFSRTPIRRPSILPSAGARNSLRLGVVERGE
jgi:hypothetical protein